MTSLPEASARFLSRAEQAGLTITVKVHTQSTRTAQDAAAACGCAVGQIVKSLVFRGANSQTPYLLLVSGSNRVDEKAVAFAIGEPLQRAAAEDVRTITGFAIGGIPPLGHDQPLVTYLDSDLLIYEAVWAAAGTPNTVFEVEPKRLAESACAKIITLKSD